MDIVYRLSDITDPEERLEDSILWKSLKDEYQDDIKLIDSSENIDENTLFMGRLNNSFLLPFTTDYGMDNNYWKQEIFKEYANRDFKVCDFEDGMKYIKMLQNKKSDVIFKSILSQKHFLCKINHDDSPHRILGDMAYSFIDRGDCLLIQEYKPMKYERRFFVVNREIITHSPVVSHLTPLDLISDNDVINQHYLRPGLRDFIYDKNLTDNFLEVARDIAQKMDDPHATFDLSLTDQGVTIIEFNPLQIGMLGLFAMDPRKISESSRDIVRDIKSNLEQNQSFRIR